MARYDKYDPISGGFRAALDVDITGDAAGEFGPKAVSLNASGRVVVGTAGISGIAGILVKNAPKRPIAAMSTSMQGTPYPTAWMGQKAGDMVTANLTPGGPLGKWTEADFFTAIRTGTRPDGTKISEQMPWKAMATLTDDELRSMWLYITSVAPVAPIAPGAPAGPTSPRSATTVHCCACPGVASTFAAVAIQREPS